MPDGDDELQATKAGASWQVSEDEDAQPPDQPTTDADMREGQVEDPNLGDIPLDRQLHPDADEPATDG
jgi:hypothetical protein